MFFSSNSFVALAALFLNMPKEPLTISIPELLAKYP